MDFKTNEFDENFGVNKENPNKNPKVEKAIESFLKKNKDVTLKNLSDELSFNIEVGKRAIASLEKRGKLVQSLNQDKDRIYNWNEFISTRFENIETPKELKEYLGNYKARLKNRKYVYHYTTISSVLAMLKSKTWYLSNPKDMNDKLEYGNGSKAMWEKLYFASFMFGENENIGMWSMYAQPWNEGVKITIPKKEFLDWFENIKAIREVDMNNQVNKNKKHIKPVIDTSIISVGYSDLESLEDVNGLSTIWWSTVKNSIIDYGNNKSVLTGYIKDSAWSYEKELRLMVKFKNPISGSKIAVDLPDYLIKSMIFTPSPLFQGNLEEEMQKNGFQRVKIERSLFENRINIKQICERCEFKLRENKVL